MNIVHCHIYASAEEWSKLLVLKIYPTTLHSSALPEQRSLPSAIQPDADLYQIIFINTRDSTNNFNSRVTLAVALLNSIKTIRIETLARSYFSESYLSPIQ